MVDELGLKQNEKKLVLTLQDTKNYVLHYKNLQFYLNQGIKLKKVHRALEFDQECWMASHIHMNTESESRHKTSLKITFRNS